MCSLRCYKMSLGMLGTKGDEWLIPRAISIREQQSPDDAIENHFFFESENDCAFLIELGTDIVSVNSLDFLHLLIKLRSSKHLSNQEP